MASSRRTRRPSRGEARVRIRRARPDDAPAIAGVMRASIRALAREAYPPRQVAAWSSLPPLYHAWAMSAGGEAYFAAEQGGRIVGYAALRASEVTAVFVRPRAARRGIGAALLARVERGARRRGVRRLRVDVALPAVSFYEAAGFRGTRRISVPLPGGERLPARRLSKRLEA